jgi:hypothetical protein
VAELGVDVDQAAVDRLARGKSRLHALLPRVFRIVRFAPETVAAESQVGHEVGVQVSEAPEGNVGLDLPVVSTKGDP